MTARGRTFAIELTPWRGFHREGGPQPAITIGWITVWWCRGSITNEFSRLRIALAEAAAELRKFRGKL